MGIAWHKTRGCRLVTKCPGELHPNQTPAPSSYSGEDGMTVFAVTHPFSTCHALQIPKKASWQMLPEAFFFFFFFVNSHSNFYSTNRLRTGQHRERGSLDPRWMDVGPPPSTWSQSSKGHTAMPVVAAIVFVWSLSSLLCHTGRAEPGVCWSVLNDQLSRGKEALICSSYQFPWGKCFPLDQSQAANMTSRSRRDAQLASRCIVLLPHSRHGWSHLESMEHGKIK